MLELVKGIVGILILLILLGVIPVVTGTLFVAPIHRKNATSLTFVYLVGIMVLVAITELLSVPMTLMKLSFSAFVWVYNAFTIVLVLLSLKFCKNLLIKIFQRAKETIQKANKLWILVLIAVYVPVTVLTFVTPYIYGDDTTYLTLVNDIVYSDRLYLTDVVTGIEKDWVLAKYSLSSFWTWLAYLAKMSGSHPLVLCKSVLSFFFVPMAYAAQGLLSAFLFKNNERKMLIYMLLVILVSIFGGFTNYSVTYRLYTWVWQSKAFLAMIVIPVLFYYCNYVFEDMTTRWEYFVLLLMILATCATTLTGTGLAVAMVCGLAGLYAIYNKNIGIFIKTFVACCPAYVLILLYLKYDQFMLMINFY